MNIYEVLNKIIVNRRFELSSRLFDDKYRNELTEEEVILFDLLKDISSIGTEIHNGGIKFHPMFTMADGSRTFSVEDITEEDFLMLEAMELNRVPLVLRALISDILWSQRKVYCAAKVSAEAYWDLFKLWFTDDDNVGTIDMIRRAVCISIQIKHESLFLDICTWADAHIFQKAVTLDGFFSLRIMELFAEQKIYDVSAFPDILERMISAGNNNVLKVEQAYELKAYCYNKLKKSEEAKNANIALADYYVNYAEQTVQRDMLGAMRAVSFFQKAISLYRNNGEPQKAENTRRRLVELQKDIPKMMVPITMELDIKGVVDNIRINMEELTFEESIIRLIQMFVFEKRENIKQRVIDEYKNYPLSHMFGENIVNERGQTTLALQPLDIRDPEGNVELLELHMYQNSLKNQRIVGDVWIKNILLYIRNKFDFENSMLDFLIKDNPIIPAGRERIFQSAIGMFIRGEYYEAMHILAPQVENLFRNIAREVGGLTVTLENDGSSMEKVLSSIFDLPELLDCYDNDIIFTFKGLLNEKAGANIRNEVAHGIISEATCGSGVCLYFGAAVVKILSFTSVPCYEILRNSERLKHFEKPSENALKIINKEEKQKP
ncbi:MAG: DUF4209 domain-containing protein [Lachnospiraceae bacterium]|nr:DUF4209 domain-containing protein [Lachnospiraceae bacterium]